MMNITYDMNIPCKIPPSKMFKALVLDSNTIMTKAMPEVIKSVEIMEGDGGVGTIKAIHFGEGSQFNSIKQRVDAIDSENLTHGYSILEGDVLRGVHESINYQMKIVPAEDGGCVIEIKSVYNTKGNEKISVEEIKEGKENAMGMFKAIEGYLHAHPDA